MPRFRCRLRAMLKYGCCLLAFCSVLLTGCSRGGGRQDLLDLAPMTTETVTMLLLGLPAELQATRPNADPGLLRQGQYEVALLSADARAFARLSGGAFSAEQIAQLLEVVTGQVDENLRKRGFRAETTAFPPQTELPRALVVALTPATQSAGSPGEIASGKGRKMVLVRVTVTDPARQTVLAQRDYYSGVDTTTKKPILRSEKSVPTP